MNAKTLPLTASALLLALAASGQDVSTTVRHSDAGMGQIDYHPGDNAAQYMTYGNSPPNASSPGATLPPTVSGDGSLLFGGGSTATYVTYSSGSRSTDFLFREAVSGATEGDTLGFTFDGLPNLGSDWANVDIFAASVNLTLPTEVNDLATTEIVNTSDVPEPSALALAVMGGLGALSLRRFRRG